MRRRRSRARSADAPDDLHRHLPADVQLPGPAAAGRRHASRPTSSGRSTRSCSCSPSPWRSRRSSPTPSSPGSRCHASPGSPSSAPAHPAVDEGGDQPGARRQRGGEHPRLPAADRRGRLTSCGHVHPGHGRARLGPGPEPDAVARPAHLDPAARVQPAVPHRRHRRADPHAGHGRPGPAAHEGHRPCRAGAPDGRPARPVRERVHRLARSSTRWPTGCSSSWISRALIGRMRDLGECQLAARRSSLCGCSSGPSAAP